MYISHKSNVIQQIADTDWDCRRKTKGLSKEEYWAWLDSVTTDGVADYSGETGYTMVECEDEDAYARLGQLNSYIDNFGINLVYDIKYYASKRNAEEIKNPAGESYDPKQYVSSHFVPDDTARDKRLLDEEWVRIRQERDKLLTESDWTQANDSPLTDANVAKWKTYRTSLRDLPSDQSSKTKYSDITWPTKP